MTPDQWMQIRYFKATENWGVAARMNASLIYELDRLRNFIGQPIVIHCGYEARNGKGYHPKGLAVDCHAKSFDAFEFLFAAIRFSFSGIGVYTWWNNPGLHLDMRPTGSLAYKALWACAEPKNYLPLDMTFIKQELKKGGMV